MAAKKRMHTWLAVTGMLVGSSAIAAQVVDPLSVGEQLGDFSGAAVLGVACVVLATSCAALVRAFIRQQHDTVQAVQQMADAAHATNLVLVEVKDAMRDCNARNR